MSWTIASPLATSQPLIAAITTYVSRFWSGGFEPFWPHVVLLSLSVLASIAVGAGILLERPKYSATVHRVAFWLVVGGIVVEAACTIFLFVFDEGISTSQQDKIISLETRLAPRGLSPQQQEAIAAKIRPFAGQQYGLGVAPGDEPLQFACLLDKILKSADWKSVAPFGDIIVHASCGDLTQTNNSGVRLYVGSSHVAPLHEAANALILALQAENVEATGIVIADAEASKNPDAIEIAVGLK